MDRGAWRARVHVVTKGSTWLNDWAHKGPKIPCFLLTKMQESEGVSCSLVSSSLWPHGLWPPRFLCSWNSPGKNTGVGCHFLLQMHQFSSLQSLSCVRLFAIPWITALQASLSITNSQSSLRFTSIESVMPSSHLILCHPLILLSSIFPSIRVFSNESTLRMRWPKYWSFSFSIIPSKELPGPISFKAPNNPQMSLLNLFVKQSCHFS